MHRHVDTSKHICPSDTQGLGQPKPSKGGAVEQNRATTHGGTDTRQGPAFPGHTHQHTHAPGTPMDTPHTSRADVGRSRGTEAPLTHPESHTHHADAAASALRW